MKSQGDGGVTQPCPIVDPFVPRYIAVNALPLSYTSSVVICSIVIRIGGSSYRRLNESVNTHRCVELFLLPNDKY